MIKKCVVFLLIAQTVTILPNGLPGGDPAFDASFAIGDEQQQQTQPVRVQLPGTAGSPFIRLADGKRVKLAREFKQMGLDLINSLKGSSEDFVTFKKAYDVFLESEQRLTDTPPTVLRANDKNKMFELHSWSDNNLLLLAMSLNRFRIFEFLVEEGFWEANKHIKKGNENSAYEWLCDNKTDKRDQLIAILRAKGINEDFFEKNDSSVVSDSSATQGIGFYLGRMTQAAKQAAKAAAVTVKDGLVNAALQVAGGGTSSSALDAQSAESASSVVKDESSNSGVGDSNIIATAADQLTPASSAAAQAQSDVQVAVSDLSGGALPTFDSAISTNTNVVSSSASSSAAAKVLASADAQITVISSVASNSSSDAATAAAVMQSTQSAQDVMAPTVNDVNSAPADVQPLDSADNATAANSNSIVQDSTASTQAATVASPSFDDLLAGFSLMDAAITSSSEPATLAIATNAAPLSPPVSLMDAAITSSSAPAVLATATDAAPLSQPAPLTDAATTTTSSSVLPVSTATAAVAAQPVVPIVSPVTDANTVSSSASATPSAAASSAPATTLVQATIPTIVSGGTVVTPPPAQVTPPAPSQPVIPQAGIAQQPPAPSSTVNTPVSSNAVNTVFDAGKNELKKSKFWRNAAIVTGVGVLAFVAKKYYDSKRSTTASAA